MAVNMTPPAGPCEWCGGPQWWTIVAGVMYVKCQLGCVSLFPEDRYDFPPPDGDLDELVPKVSMERIREEGVGPPEGAAANGSDVGSECLEEPPPGFLDSLWEGTDGTC